MDAIVKCSRLNISENVWQVTISQESDWFYSTDFLRKQSHLHCSSFTSSFPTKMCFHFPAEKQKNTTLHLIRLDNNWRSGCVATSWRECGNQKLSRWRAKVTLQLFWVSFLYFFITLSEMQIPRMPDTPIFQCKYKNKIESQPLLSLLPVILIGLIPSPLLLTSTNLDYQKLSLFIGDNSYIKKVTHKGHSSVEILNW